MPSNSANVTIGGTITFATSMSRVPIFCHTRGAERISGSTPESVVIISRTLLLIHAPERMPLDTLDREACEIGARIRRIKRFSIEKLLHAARCRRWNLCRRHTERLGSVAPQIFAIHFTDE